MLQTRKIEKNTDGSYCGVFGQGNANFITGGDALAQILTHQILTVKKELKTNVDFGVSWFDKTHGLNGKTIIDTQIKNIIISNPYVKRIMSFQSTFNNATQTYNLITKILTTEGLLLLTL